MILLKSAGSITDYCLKARANGVSIGFVPTMGALHAGHISLIQTSVTQNGLTVCSIFVNPTQFNNPEDFKKYPITIERDIDMLEKAGCDLLFLPELEEIYPASFTPLHYDLGYLEQILEGKYRPGHFQGVCQVVDSLLDIVQPTNLFLGQKDYQQCMVLKRLVEIKNYRVNLVICETMRENDGLAMSSRNMRLNAQQRLIAPTIYESMMMIKLALKPGLINNVKTNAVEKLHHAGFKVDYIEIVDAKTLEIIENWNGKQKLVVVIAAYLDEIRLIDNLRLL